MGELTQTTEEVQIILDQGERGIVTLPFFIPMSGVTDSEFDLTGNFTELNTGVTGDYTTNFALNNNHLAIHVTALTTGGTVTVTGDKIDEATEDITEGATEDVTIGAGTDKRYQTFGKWQVITNIDVSGTTGMTYDIDNLGYFDAANRPFRVYGYRADVKTSSSTADLRQTITAVKNRGGNEFELVVLDDVGFDSTTSNGTLYDHVREDPAGFYTSPVNLVANNALQVKKRVDIATYIGSDADVDGSNNEGIIISFSGEPSGGLTGIDHATLYLTVGSVV